MSKFAQFAVAACCVAGISACSTINTNDGCSTIPESEIKMPEYKVILERVKTPARVSGEASVHVLFGIFSWGPSAYADNTNFGETQWFSTTRDAKTAATYNACKENNVDVVLGAKYVLEQTNYFIYKKVKCSLSGYPARIVDLQEIKD